MRRVPAEKSKTRQNPRPLVLPRLPETIRRAGGFVGGVTAGAEGRRDRSSLGRRRIGVRRLLAIRVGVCGVAEGAVGFTLVEIGEGVFRRVAAACVERMKDAGGLLRVDDFAAGQRLPQARDAIGRHLVPAQAV